ncbi:DUF72 domain-containing protein [Leptolyngbya sp. FACHB-402]|jgi:uncharacterized protein YecE (DUF72 family)|nr:DUF72 domain-containing protein [Leptolyngbya sp. FACHB-161]MBD2376222.1 DUF72 domain-containing protein [Leptolyngbya sp. FACHB-238]MBD2400497.1 DUF72 domain-containing protein [Leptolyngbya sp. FACHB-239]MBD2407039.1 DUF72 domain-containing protein [Leptolyngbya sp. FACHB-402]
MIESSFSDRTKFRMGCAIWAYKQWVGDLFPPKSKASDFLNLYSRRFACVEGNTTFYSIPDRATVGRWKSETPLGFKFCPKLPKTLTHSGKLASSISGALKFLELMQGLDDRLGVLFAQLPPSYSPANFADLETFLRGWKGADLALEVRHARWFQEPHRSRLNELLQELKIGRVLLDTRPIYECEDDPQLESERKKPKVPLQPDVTAPFTLIRYISHPTLNQQYLEEWVKIVDRWLQQGTEIYFFVHCPVEEHSPQNARQFQRLLEQQDVNVPPLPWDLIEQPPSQMSLF